MEGTTKIKDLTPSSRRVNVLGKVVSVSEPKEIQTRFGEPKSVTEVVLADDSGKVILSLWGDQAKLVSDGKTVYIDNGYISLVRGHMRLNVGKYGSLADGTEEITEINESLDMSEKEYENEFRRYGGGGSRGGFRRGGNDYNRNNDRRNRDD